jgi:hypothetical protein
MTKRIWFWFLIGLLNAYAYSVGSNIISLICGIYCAATMLVCIVLDNKAE